MTSKRCIEITDKSEVIREMDMVRGKSRCVFLASTTIGMKLGDTNFEAILRPAPVDLALVCESARDLLRVITSELAHRGSYQLIEPEVNNLMQSLGVTIEELRGGE